MKLRIIILFSFPPMKDKLKQSIIGKGISASTVLLTLAGVFLFTTLLPAHPVEVGTSIADNVVGRTLGNGYAVICSYYGTMIFADATHNDDLRQQVIVAYEPYLTGAKQYREGHVDYNVFGILPFELYRQTRNPDYLPIAKYLADIEFENPDPNGLSLYTRFWVDDMYMVGSLQAQAYKSLQDPNYLNNGVTQLLGYIEDVEQLQKPNGLFHHTLNAPFFWGRGNGWAAAAMTETLLAMPLDHPKRNQLLAAYQRMMDGLLPIQDESGLWYQLLDRPDDPDNWLETSCTGMFVFALATGVDQEWLPGSAYRDAAVKGWLGLENYVNQSGEVLEVCVGTGQGTTAEHYFNRPRQVGNFHGQAAVLWAATAMIRSGLILPADFHYDGIVNGLDFAQLARHWQVSENWIPVQDPNSPVGHWPLDEEVGTVAHDTSPSANHGTLFTAQWDPNQGRFDGAVMFAASEYDYIEIPTSAMSVSQGTISLWVKLNPDPQPDRHVYVFGHGTESYWTNRIQLYMNNGDRKLDLGLGDSHTRATSIKILQTETWYHIALTWNQGQYAVYVNGIPEAGGSYTGFDTLNSIADIGNDGRNDGSQRDEAFHGRIDEVRIFDYSLTAMEIAYLAGQTNTYIPFPEETIPFDLYRDNRIDSLDLHLFLQMWLMTN